MPVLIKFSSPEQARAFVRIEKVTKGEILEDNGAELTVETHVQGQLIDKDYEVVSIEDLAGEAAKS